MTDGERAQVYDWWVGLGASLPLVLDLQDRGFCLPGLARKMG